MLSNRGSGVVRAVINKNGSVCQSLFTVRLARSNEIFVGECLWLYDDIQILVFLYYYYPVIIVTIIIFAYVYHQLKVVPPFQSRWKVGWMGAWDGSQAQESTHVRSLGDFKLWNMKVILIGKSLRFAFKKETFWLQREKIWRGRGCKWAWGNKQKLKMEATWDIDHCEFIHPVFHFEN